jgi:hypothetical protein
MRRDGEGSGHVAGSRLLPGFDTAARPQRAGRRRYFTLAPRPTDGKAVHHAFRSRQWLAAPRARPANWPAVVLLSDRGILGASLWSRFDDICKEAEAARDCAVQEATNERDRVIAVPGWTVSDRVKAAASARYETKVTIARTKCENDCENARRELMRALDQLEAEYRGKLLWCAVAEAKATFLAATLPLPS